MKEGSFAEGLGGEPVMGLEAEKDQEIIDVARNIRADIGLPELAQGAKDAFEGLDDKQKAQLRKEIENWRKGVEMMQGI